MSFRRTLLKLMDNPWATTRNAWRKGVIEPLQYSTPAGAYDARRYWSNRFTRHGESLRGPGDEGLSDEQNRREYAAAGEQFLALCHDLSLDYSTLRVLEIGPGSGYYTQLLRQLGVCKYTGLDIAASLLPSLARQFTAYQFAQADVTQLPIAGGVQGLFDIIAIIDVIEHIVERQELHAAISGLEALLVPGGRLLIAPLMDVSKRHLFYVHFWSLADVCGGGPSLRLEKAVPFRQGKLASLCRSHRAD